MIFHVDRLEQPLHWRKPRRVFVNSMSDLFHENVPFNVFLDIYRIMARASRHIFQVLTKRPERMREFLRHPLVGDIRSTPLPHVWWGVSVEDQRRADERIPVLLDTPAAVRFLSIEPLLGPVDLTRGGCTKIDWCIVGGESGPKARTCHVGDIREIVSACRRAGVPVFVKQLGAKPIRDMRSEVEDVIKVGMEPIRLVDRKGANIDEWPDDLRVREWPDTYAF